MNYYIKQFPDKSFTDKMDMIRFMKKNCEEMFSIKKSEYKTKTDAGLSSELFIKEVPPIIEDITGEFIQVKTIINTTNVIDSHNDLHLPGIWNKTVKDNPISLHLKSHKADFEYVISNKAKSYNEEMNFKDLGLSADMPMQANINEFVLERSKMPTMFDAYKNGEVNQHSVGMMYVKIDLAYYDEDSQKEMDFFDLMKSKAINPEVADDRGYFWVVSEAKKREGSAVVFGSNSITPTLWVKNYEPGKKSTSKAEPSNDTQNAELLKNLLTKFN